MNKISAILYSLSDYIYVSKKLWNWNSLNSDFLFRNKNKII